MMKGTDIVKWGLVLWLSYEVLKEINSNGQISNNNSNYSPRDNLTLELKSIEEAFDKAFKKPSLLEPPLQLLKLVPDVQTVEAGNWLKLIHHPLIVVILGGRGKGKSALGYRILEYLRWTASCYVVGLPGNARGILPDWVGMVTSLEDVPPKAIVLIDEAYMPYHARSSMATEARVMSQMINLSRQREQTLIFVSQEARQVDRNIISSANVIIFKDPGILQLEFDRRELNKIAVQAKQAFAGIKGNRMAWSYIYAPDSDFTGLVENSLPSFWKEKLSHVFATGGEITARPPNKIPLEQRIEKAKQLRHQGLSLGQIAKLMGASKGTIKNWLDDYPYK